MQRWQQGGGELRVVTSAEEWAAARVDLDVADLVVDALLGTGVKGRVEGLLGSVIEDDERAGARKRRGGFAELAGAS